MLIGLISDTHDLLRPAALELLEGVDHIMHTGDVCNPDLLAELRKVAPLNVVRGNCDHGDWAEEIPVSDTFELDGIFIHARHILANLDLDPAAAGINLVLFGHTHDPHQEERRGVTYFNPGSAGPRRFSLPISMALMRTHNGAFEIEFKTIED